MDFQYGSDSLDIQNPFKKEGLYYIISGIIIAIIGILSVLTLRSQVLENGTISGWISVGVSLFILALGIQFLTKGFIRLSRFYVGRGVPTSLSDNKTKSEKNTVEPNAYYSSNALEQMLMGRKNTTFDEPTILFERAMYSILPNLLFLPHSMRNYIYILVRNTSLSLIGLMVFLIAYLSGSIGLTNLTQETLLGWLGVSLSLLLILIWFFNPLSLSKVNEKTLLKGTNTKIALIIVLAILVPVLLELGIREGVSIPTIPFNPSLFLIVSYLLIGVVFTVGIILAKQRSELSNPNTEVSESRDHWQENVHPKDFFRALDMEMADLRYKEIPNRVYRELNPNLNMEGSMDKGSFEGDTIQETQPIFEPFTYNESLQTSRFIASILGHVFVIVSALLFFMLSHNRELTDFMSIFNSFSYPLILLLFGMNLLTIAHLFWGEMLFKSNLIQFHGEGTYTESKLSVGMSITDSTRSENTVVRTSYSSWFLVSELITTIQARPGANTLNRARYIMTINRSDDLLQHLVNRIKGFLDEREMVATTNSELDDEAMSKIYSLNDRGSKQFEELTEEQKHLSYGNRRKEEIE
ncbi:hypothetical protein ACKXGF_12300 [Alkalibacillus sp. S2W]|uniref:hypothetical protein n=1 Tax=Alkalibacillus sp. S2W TaxID=3386553 RepID=UPI00398D4A3B